MMHAPMWIWVTLFLLGAWHGVNPAMGWLFAVALGLQRQDRRAVLHSLIPIATGHVLAIGIVVALALFAGAVIPQDYARWLVAGLLLAFGVFRLRWGAHPRFGGMQVGFRDLTLWSFLTASAHGAGFMLLPILLGMSFARGGHALHAASLSGGWAGVFAVTVHTLAYLVVTGLIAWVVFTRVGLAILRRAWLNVDRIWAISLVITASLTLFLTT